MQVAWKSHSIVFKGQGESDLAGSFIILEQVFFAEVFYIWACWATKIDSVYVVCEWKKGNVTLQ
jgi:hypothetical protein